MGLNHAMDPRYISLLAGYRNFSAYSDMTQPIFSAPGSPQFFWNHGHDGYLSMQLEKTNHLSQGTEVKLQYFRRKMCLLNPHFIFIFYFNDFLPHQIFHLQGMQLTTNSSTLLMCYLALQWNSWICTFKSFQLICLNPHFISIPNCNFFLPHPIFYLQGMQLTTNSCTPLTCWLVYEWDCWIGEL